MSVTAHAPANGGLRLRAVTLGLAAATCATLAYLAVTQRFGVVTELFGDSDPIVTIIEAPEPPPAPPPIAAQIQPPPMQQAPIDTSAPPVEYPGPVLDSQPAPPTPFITNPTFLQRPSGRDFARYFPERALQRGESGRVVLDCVVAADGRVGCNVLEESPAGWGFGDASLRAAQHFRVAPATTDGRPTSGGRLRVPMTWRAE